MKFKPLILVAALALTLSQAASATGDSLADLLARQDYKAAGPLLKPLLAKRQPSEAERAAIYTWLFARDDMAQVDRRSRAGRAAVDWQAAGRLAMETYDYPRAETCFKAALAAAKTPADQAAAEKGLGQLEFRLRRFDAALTHLEASIAALPTADGYAALNETLIRLGRTDEAITAAETAVKLNPYQELAHYQLGNGYARKNYTQLAAAYGPRFDEAMALAKRASDAFEQARFDEARDLSFAALKVCPELGRAHAILARTLESQRFLIDVHRPDYERRFAAAKMPMVPGIEQYVSNWKDLTPRVRKRVALSVAPWKAYIPVLVAGGSQLFIKPMAMKLSDAPNMQSLKDARIDYDSRLWDDVRGSGGYSTVTGVEDVERTIFDRYNTVLHELSHQVHGIMTADQWRQIQDLYNKAKTRDAKTRNGFLSRYAGGSVWEYFAEGANGLESPPRDKYDTRDIRLDRLQAIDPDLLALEKKFMAQTDVSASLPISYANAGNDLIGNGRLEPALAYLAKAQQVAPDDELVLSSSLFAESLRGDRTAVEALAARALKTHPDSGTIRVAAAQALWHSGHALPALLDQLGQGRERLSGDDAFKVDLELADGLRKLGRVDAALTRYADVLKHQADSPEGLWGKAATLALAERWDEAFAAYAEVLRLRTGLVPLRADYTRDLLLAGRKEDARKLLKEALLLDANDPTLVALDGWIALADGDAKHALARADEALAKGPWSDLGLIVRAAAQKALGQDAAALPAVGTPSYVYRADQSAWVSVHEGTAAEARIRQRLIGAQ
ncbi:tetratricopeptide repeat protein [Pelomonas sp. KK5]|uniref:tetratricopeptide repeat protein n=1 Tax=Pelomonas sp. KK5 TaxID=1855730 RepID=UPI00097C6563|nr:tetratricopeptide repeat protein [Pelomonas sp. KK5]